MIKIRPLEIPEILQLNQLNWTQTLINTIKIYGSYSAIPQKIKNQVINHYRNEEIKERVKEITKNKCVFCESSIEIIDYTNIEHFHPKSIHPKFAFKWSNLLPSCRRCNISKGNFDTRNKPFINPFDFEPEEHLYYRDLKIYAINGNLDAENTIKNCDLNRTELMRTRSQILISFYDTEDLLEVKNNAYKELKRKTSQIKLSNDLLNSLLSLKNLSDYYSAYAGFSRNYITNSIVINQTVEIINDNYKELGLDIKFAFKWQ